MSKQDVFGASMKEWSLMILMLSLAMTFIIVGYTFYIAVTQAPAGSVEITGAFDLGQWQAVVLGIAITATVLVSQQLTKKDNAVLMQFLKEQFNKEKDEPSG